MYQSLRYLRANWWHDQYLKIKIVTEAIFLRLSLGRPGTTLFIKSHVTN